jgi:polyisoprenoid-binding protein YceI
MRWLLAVSLLISVFVCQAQTYVPVQDQSSVRFKIKNFGLNVEGSFSDLMGTVKFDPSDLSSSKVNVSILASTLTTGISLRDKHLKKEEYFDVANYPRIQFTSTDITLTKQNEYIVSGKLTLKKTTKQISFPFTSKKMEKNYVLKGEFTLDRTAYDVGENSFSLADEVTVQLSIVLQQEK